MGTDIQDCKCSWLVVQALARASPPQKQVLTDCYGKKDAGKVAQVKQLYQQLALPDIYKAYEESSYVEIVGLIDKLGPDDVPRDVFDFLLNKIYKRSK